ncbi:hypothetical protein MZE46_010830 [Pseudomonas sp. A4]|nr:hypothetical protein [Pseudomonas sp. S11A4]
MVLSALSILGGCAVNNSDTLAHKPMSPLEQDQQLVAMGILPPSVLEIDAELEKVPPNSPRALQLQKQKLAATQLQQNRLRAEEPYPPVSVPSQLEEQEQRMCSVNNGSAIYLVPC